jgi:deazaflavin-dependent oxidoreductase (nitroreductase family)
MIYRLGLGWLLGNRFLLLEHRGRKTGLLRRAVLEVIDSNPETREYVVVSGFGSRSDWYRNIQAHPSVTIQIGRTRLPALAFQLSPDEAGKLLLRYWENHPGSLQTLSNLLGYDIELTPEGVESFGEGIPVIRFSPSSIANKDPNHEDLDQYI